MAVHRRPPVEGPPVELLTFRGDDWISDDDVPRSKGGIKPVLSGRRRTLTISVLAGTHWRCCVNGLHISGVGGRD